ncbi:MAG: hypothetical protein JSS81_29415 [Acidobacteria bacterium]|nr:hypothetical protein [Acidobacteriota bacterium]
MKRKLILLAFLLAAVWPLRAQTTEPPKTDEAELRRQAFEKVWTTVNEKHYDPTFGGVDWKKVREIYEPQAMAAKTLADFHAVLRRMVGELKLSHFGIYPREAPAAKREAGGTTGIELKMIDGRPVIYRIEKDSPAEKAGLKPGFELRAIDGKTTAALLDPLEKIIAERTSNENVKKVYRERFLGVFLDGKPETVVRIEVLDAGGKPQTFAVARAAAAPAEMSEAFGNFPPQPVVFEARRLENNIGYIRFNMWVIPQMAKIRKAIREFADARGIVFDLRGNPGGIGGMAPGVAGLLMSEQVSFGSMKGRDSEQKFIVYPQSNPFAGRVVILTDYATGSTSEIFAAGMQDTGRAIVIGERTAGAVLPSVFDTLPTGVIFQYAISDYRSPKNVLVEGRGVAPDTEVKETRAALLAGRDLPLEAAVRQILN